MNKLIRTAAALSLSCSFGIAGCLGIDSPQEPDSSSPPDDEKVEQTGEAQEPWTRAQCSDVYQKCMAVAYRTPPPASGPLQVACAVGYAECVITATD